MGTASDGGSDQEWAEIERFFEPESIGRPRKYPSEARIMRSGTWNAAVANGGCCRRISCPSVRCT